MGMPFAPLDMHCTYTCQQDHGCWARQSQPHGPLRWLSSVCDVMIMRDVMRLVAMTHDATTQVSGGMQWRTHAYQIRLVSDGSTTLILATLLNPCTDAVDSGRHPAACQRGRQTNRAYPSRICHTTHSCYLSYHG